MFRRSGRVRFHRSNPEAKSRRLLKRARGFEPLERRVLLTSITIDLQAGSDSGAFQTDNITNDTSPTYDVTVDGAGTIEIDWDGDSVVDYTGSPAGAGTYAVTAGADGTFSSRTDYGMGDVTTCVVGADFNGDGHIDLATTNQNVDTVSVRLGNGDGTFGAEATSGAGDGPRSVFSGDFNNDGDADLATANMTSNNVSVLLGNGDGTFQAHVTYGVGSSPRCIYGGDFNNDSNADLVTANINSSNVSVLLGAGDGTFGTQTTYTMGSGTAAVFSADFNNDSNADLVTANINGDNVSIRLGNGDGTFGARTNYTMGDYARSVFSADFNGDGNADLATADFNDDNVSVRLGDGDGTFGARVYYAMGNGPVNVFSADVNADGVPDLLTANYYAGNASVRLGVGDGTFGARANYAMGGGTHNVFSADLNGDGAADMATANYNVDSISVRLAASPLTDGYYPVNASFTDVGGTATDSDPTTVDTTANVWINLQAASDSGVSSTDNITTDVTPTFNITVDGNGTIELDHDGDGNPEQTLEVSSAGTYALTAANATGTFGARSTHSVGNSPSKVFSADFNHDGKADVVTPNYNGNNVSVCLGNGDGSFDPAVNYSVGAAPMGAFSADFNGDGNADLATANESDSNVSVLLGDGTGVFGGRTDYSMGLTTTAVFCADFNNDGNADLVTANWNGNNVSVRLGVGDGTFGAQATYAMGSSPSDVFSADFNNDGNADLVTANWDSDNMSVRLGNGNGTFGARTNYSGVGDNPSCVFSEDFNGDGNADVVIGSYTSNDVAVMLGDGSGGFGSPDNYLMVFHPIDVTCADFNADGVIDMATGSLSHNNVRVRRGIGDGTFGGDTAYSMGSFPEGIVSDDFNNDGIADLVTADSDDNTISIRLGNSNPLSDGTYPFDVTFTDVAGNTDTDSDSTTIDTQAPAKPGVPDLQGGSDTGVSDTDNLTNDRTPTFNVSSTDAYFRFYRDGGQISGDYESGSAYTTPQLPTGTYTSGYALSAVDAAGNESALGNALSVTIDTDAPATPPSPDLQPGSDSGLSSTDDITNDTTPTFDVASTDTYFRFRRNGSRISGLYETGTTFTPLTAQADATWDYTVRAVDAAGNLSPDSTALPVTIDTVAAAPVVDLQAASDSGVSDTDNITNDTTPTYDVTVSEAGTIEVDWEGDSGVEITSLLGGAETCAIIAGADGTFGAEDSYGMGDGAAGVFSADFDNDGNADVAISNAYADTVSVRLGIGDGTFGAEGTIGVGDKPRSVFSADFNNDGNADLVTDNENADTVSVLLGRGDGTFDPHVTYATGDAPWSVFSADFDGDANIDLVTANRDSDTVSVLLGNGDGTFDPHVTYTMGDAPGGVFSADFNNDANPDLVTANINSDNVSVRLGVGDGTFGGPTDYTDYAMGDYARSVFSADFNGDGNADLATANYFSGNVSVRLGIGDGTFSSRANYAMDSGPVTVFSADVNGDGVADLLSANNSASNVSMRPGTGDGTFGSVTDYGMGGGAHSLFCADLNNDGVADMLTANLSSDSFSVRLGETTPLPDGDYPIQVAFSDIAGNPAPDFGSDPTTIDTVANVTVDLQAASDSGVSDTDNITNDTTPTYDLTLEAGTLHIDYDGDGTPDLIDSIPTGGTYAYTASLSPFLLQQTTSVGDAPQGIYSADFNGDGNADLAFAHSNSDNVHVLLGDGTGAFVLNQTVPLVGAGWEICGGDFNGDSIPDLAVAVQQTIAVNWASVLLGQGDGTFAAAQDYAVGRRPRGISSADLNGDGSDDLVTTSLPGDNVSVLLNNGDGSGIFQPQTTYDAGNGPVSVVSADLNGDAVADLVTANQLGDDVSVLLGTGGGAFGTPASYGAGDYPQSVFVGDFDGDSVPDLVAANRNTDNVSVLMGLGGGAFAGSVSYAAGDGPCSVFVADLDGDAKLDLAVANQTSDDVSVLSGNGDGTFEAQEVYATGDRPVGVIAGYMNSDAVLDIAVANTNSDNVSVLLGQHTELADGIHPVNVSFTDIAGNPATCADPTTIDTEAPAVPPPLDLQAASDTGVSDTDDITNDDTPTFDVASTDAYFRVYRDGGQVSADYASGATWTEPDSNGDAIINYAVSSVDAAGNESSLSDALVVTIDTEAPAVPPPLDLQAASDTGVSDTDDITNDDTPTFDVASTDAYFRVYRDGGQVSADYASGATWTEPVSNGDAIINYAVSSVDAAGNESSLSDALTVTIDTESPSFSGEAWISSTHGDWAAGDVSFSDSVLTDYNGVIPWSRVNRIGFRFSEDVHLGEGAMSFSAALREGTLDPGTAAQPSQDEAVWTWSDPDGGLGGYLDTNWIKIKINAPDVTDTAGNPLDADHLQNVKVLPGDVDGDGSVLSGDRLSLLGHLATFQGQPSYDPRADADNDGITLTSDRVAQLQHMGASLPAEPSDPGGGGEVLLGAAPNPASQESAKVLLREISAELRRAPAYDLLGRLTLRAPWLSRGLPGRIEQ